MQVIAMIPARLEATRFRHKLLQPLGNKTVIENTYDNVVATNLFDSVYVVTDSEIIFNTIANAGGNALMSKKEHESGSDRIAEAAELLDADVIINIQGDEPFVNRKMLEDIVRTFKADAAQKVQVVSVMRPLTDATLIASPNVVKVVVDANNNSLLFSRSPIPFIRDESAPVTTYQHVGIYAFRKNALLQFTQWPQTPLEQAEKIECLRYLENGIQLKMVTTNATTIAIDVPEDLERAQQHWEQLHK
jgi:3-deoxy-manno-octulosonate cytidylyltransferase (CMP-KDO synthetase)